MGSFGQLPNGAFGFKANFDVNYTPVSDSYPGAAPAEVVVQEGDTLRLIASRIYGDSNLWYLIAEENGLTNPDDAPLPGTVLRVPNDVVSFSNASETFRAFTSEEVIGHTTPTQPFPPAPKPGKKGCGVFGAVLVLVVAIVVTIYTYGATKDTLYPAWAGVVSATSGAVASQTVGIAIGQQSKFDWKGVAAAAISGGLGGAATSALSGLSGVSGQVVTAIATTTINQGVNIALGLQKDFNWAAVVASAVAAPLAAAAEKGTTQAMGGSAGKVVTDFTAGLVRSGIHQISSLAFNGGKIDSASLVADAFGNALGNSIVARSSGPSAAPVPAGSSGNGLGSFDPSPYRNRALDELSLADLRTDAGLSNNPRGVIYEPGAELSPDELANLATVTITGTPILPGEDAGLDISAGLYQQSWQMNREQRALVDEIGEAAATNYEWRQRYGRNALWATDQIARGYEALTGAPAGTGQQLLALGYNGGLASWGGRIAGTIIGGTQGVMEGVGLGTMGMLEFGRDAAGAAGYLLTGSSSLESPYERYGAAAASLVDFVSGDLLGTLGGALSDYGSRVALLNSADPSLSGRIAGKPFGELIAPGAALGTGARVGRLARMVGSPQSLLDDSAVAAARAEAAANIRQARNLLKDAGVPLQARNEIVRSFDLETFRVQTTTSELSVLRLFDDFSARLEGRYVSTDFFLGQIERIQNFALMKNSATRLAEVTVPRGSVVFTGRVAPQPNFGPGLTGGANQMFLTGPLSNYRFQEILLPRPGT